MIKYNENIGKLMRLGGCQADKDETSTKPSETDLDELPEVRAFTDSFTRDFLQSTEETREGYYLFVPGTGNYRMNFPAEGVIGQRAYSIRKKGYEEFPIHIKDETGTEIRVNYYSNNKKDLIKNDLHAFKKHLGYECDFKKVKKNDRTLYYAHYEDDIFRTYAGYILNERGTGGIEVIYNIDCQDKKEEICEKNKQNDKERAMKWMESVQFINGDET